MILCINANAAIDKTVVIPQFRLGAIQRPQQVLAAPGGKGINVARGLRQLGEAPVVAGWVGGFSGQFIEAGLRDEGIRTALVRSPRESRTCLSILDPASGALTEIYERGEPVPAPQVAEFMGWFEASVAEYAAVICSGSLPPGLPDDFYAGLLEIARARRVPGFLDSSGAALRAGLERGRPLLIKPNAHEFADLLGRAPEGVDEVGSAAIELAARHDTIVAVSLGAQGMVAAQAGGAVHARPPSLAIQSAVGSGDCTLAGLAYGLIRRWPLADAARYGVAAGTANALSVGAGSFTTADFERVHAEVQVAPLAAPAGARS